MPHARQDGGTYCFTLVTGGGRPHFADPARVQRLRTALRAVMAARPFRIVAMVVLPDHLHAIWTLPRGDADHATRWRAVRRRTAMDSRVRGFWGRPLGAVWLEGAEAIRQHVDYLHYNPVWHGLVATPAHWPHSSFHRYARCGYYAAGWGERRPEAFEGFVLSAGEPVDAVRAGCP